MAILDQYGKAMVLEAKPPTPKIQARYDNATTTDANARNWWAADYLSAKAANSYAVRRTLRIRCRYEVSNNPHLWGVCTNNADDLIDSGPTLQCLGSKEFSRRIERLWTEWAKEVELADKLRTCKLAKTIDGEGFLILKTVNDLENPVKLYPVDVEADQVTTPAPQTLAEWWVDGIDLHPVTGKPKSYHVLKYHPGDFWIPGLNPLKTEIIPARNVIHWFPKFRPGQVRGIPIFTPSLDLFTELRSFRKSVLEAAQTAANHSAVIETDAPAGMDDDDGNQEDYRFQRVAINRNMMTVLPARWKMSQFAAQNPNAQYEAFMEKGLSEAIRPLSYPLNLALGTSQKFNFSSAKLDHINYRASLRNERENECERVILEPLFRAFIEEARLTPGLLPPGVYSAADVPHAWHWPGFESIDPMTDAQADQLRLSGGQDTWQDFWARRGCDWRDVMARQSEAQKEIERLKLVFGEPLKQTQTETNGDDEGNVRRKPDKADASKKNRIKSVFDESKHPRADDGKFGEGGSDHPSHEHSMSGLADKLPDESASPGTWKKIKSFVSTASKAIYTGAAKLGQKLHDIAPDVLDVAADYAKIFYAGKGSGRGDTPDPFTESMGVGANTIAVVASHLLGRASVWLKKKTGISFANDANGEPIDVSAIVDILETMFREMHEDLGIEDMEIDRDELEKMIEERVGAKLEE